MPEREPFAKAPAARAQLELVEVGTFGSGSRYEVYGEIASGGMASVQYGRLFGPRGFSRAVAIKRLHPHFAKEPEFVTMFVDEARLSARLVHANIIHTLDVIETPGEVALVMEYVHGEALWTLLRLAKTQSRAIPVQVACGLIASVLHGLHAAHEATGDAGEPLHIVHRDVSPQNILIGSDGIPRLLDFGIAKALGRLRSTPSGEIKGKLGYIAREQLQADQVDRRTDVYGASAVLWEVLTGVPLFDGPSESAIVHKVLYGSVPPPSAQRSDVPCALDAIVLRGLQRTAKARYASALDMALELERTVGLATQSEIAAWLLELAGPHLTQRAEALKALQEKPQAARAPLSARGGTLSSTRRVGPDAATCFAPVEALVRPAGGPTQRRSRRKHWWLWASAVVCLLTSGYLYARSVSRGPVRATPAAALDRLQPSAAEMAVQPRSPQPQAATEPALAPVASPLSEREAEPPLTAAKASDPKLHIAPHARAPRAAGTRAGQHDKSSDANCTLFYEIDDLGIRRPKPECL